MQTHDFEKAFSDFLDDSEYEKTADFIFGLVRSAFSAGWQAAGGPPPVGNRLFEVLR